MTPQGDPAVPLRAIVPRQLAAIGQTFFVDHPLAGFVALVSVAAGAPQLAVAGILAAALARCLAVLFGASPALLASGLVELNGWFVGLACARFYPVGPSLVVAGALGSGLTAAGTIVLFRALRGRDLPVSIAPYMPAFWIVWSALSGLSWATPTTLTVAAPTTTSGFVLVLVCGLRGLGQIFFVPSAAVGLGIAVAASMHDGRTGPLMVLASTASIGIGYLLGTPAWQVDQGLAGFTPALIVAATMCGFIEGGLATVVVAIIASPFLEAAALRITGGLGLHALSVSYVALLWTAVLVLRGRRLGSQRLDRKDETDDDEANVHVTKKVVAVQPLVEDTADQRGHDDAGQRDDVIPCHERHPEPGQPVACHSGHARREKVCL